MFWAVKGWTCKGWVTLFKPPCPPWKTSILCFGGDWEKYGSVFHPHSFRDEIRRGNTILIARWWLNFVKQCQARLNILPCELDSEQQLATSEKWLQKKNHSDCRLFDLRWVLRRNTRKSFTCTESTTYVDNAFGHEARRFLRRGTSFIGRHPGIFSIWRQRRI